MNKFEQAGDPNTPPEVLEQLATDEEYWVRRGVACHSNTSPKALEQLATDEHYGVRYNVAQNPNTPCYIKKYIKIQKYLSCLHF
jgi:hypothetical protein